MSKRLLILFLFFTAFTAVAGPVTYTFCIKAQGFESFRAVVTFRAIDFGESTARQMVMNEVRPAFGESAKITITKQVACPCDNNCQTLKLTPKEWGGKMGDNFEKGGVKTIPSSSAAAIDHLVYEAQSLFSDPGDFLRRNFFGKK